MQEQVELDKATDKPTISALSDIDYKLGYGFIPFGLKADWDKVTFSIDFRKNFNQP